MRAYWHAVLALVAIYAGPPAIAQDGPPSAPTRYGKQYAVVVGINYSGTDNAKFVSPLKNAQNDAAAFHRRLIDWYGYAEQDATLLIGPEAVKGKIEAAILDMLRRGKEDDSVLFYFSGHGEQRQNRTGGATYAVLVPFDAKGMEVENRTVVDPYSCIHFDELVKQKFLDANARHSLILLDCCYSGQILKADRMRGPLKMDRAFDPAAFKARGIQAMTAGLANKRVSDGDGEHSPFTQALLDALEKAPQALKPNVTSFTTDVLFHTVEAQMMDQIQAKKARPLFGLVEGSEDEANFHFFPNAAAIRNASETSKLAAPAEILRFDVQSLTGLAGQWWFDETPWLVPSIRAELGMDLELAALRMDEASGVQLAMRGDLKAVSAFLDPDIDRVHRLLRDQIAKKNLLSKNDPTARFAKFARDNPAKLEDDALAGHARKIEDWLKTEKPRPADRHLLAVLKHRLNKPGADEEYRKTLAEYESLVRDKPGATSLMALCHIDFGRFLMSSSRYEESIEQYRAAERLVGKQPDVLYVDSLCNRAEAHFKRGDWSEGERCAAEAVRLAAARLPSSHPLLAYAHQKSAWNAFERWRLRDATESFEKANQVFANTVEASDHATITRLHGLHGRAMTERYAGRLVEARKRFREIDTEISKVLNDRHDGGQSPLFKQRLCERRVNTKERMADSYLFCGQPAEASLHYTRAIELAKDLPANLSESFLFQLYAKKAIALGLSDDAKGAVEALKAAGSQRLIAKQFREMGLVLKLAEAVADKAKGDDDSLDVFVAWAKSAKFDEMRRDDLELVLLASVTLNNGDGAENIKRILGVALNPKESSVRPFARRYQNAVIRRLAEGNPEDASDALLSWVLYAKTGIDGDMLTDLREGQTPVLLLHADDSFGLAVLFKPGVSPIVSIFNEGHSAWKALAKGKASPPPWDGVFADAMAGLEGPIAVYWADPVCIDPDTPYPFAFPPADRCKLVNFDTPVVKE